MGNKTKVKDTTIGVILGASLAIPYFFSQGYFDPRPYNNVSVDQVKYVEDNKVVVIDATFVKTEECDFQALKVFGELLGSWVELPWTDPSGDKGDRYAGYNTLYLNAHTDGVYFSKIEVRTRHTCDGKKVDETFLSREPDGYISVE